MDRYETTKATDAVKALKASLKPQATARRDGRWQTLDAALLVPGDLVLLGSGSHIPADCRVLRNHAPHLSRSRLGSKLFCSCQTSYCVDNLGSNPS